MLEENNYSKEVDLWSIGCIFAEMMLGEPLFSGNDEIEVMKNIFGFFGIDYKELANIKQIEDLNKYIELNLINAKKIFDSKFNKVITSFNQRDLLEKLLKINQKERITAEESLSHSYLLDKNLKKL